MDVYVVLPKGFRCTYTHNGNSLNGIREAGGLLLSVFRHIDRCRMSLLGVWPFRLKAEDARPFIPIGPSLAIVSESRFYAIQRTVYYSVTLSAQPSPSALWL